MLDVAIGEYGADYNTLVESAKVLVETNMKKEVKMISENGEKFDWTSGKGGNNENCC